MKVAILGVWHVHAPDYTNKALALGEVVGFYERNDALAEAFNEKLGLHRFSTLDELLKSDAEGVIVCSATCDHASDIIKAAEAKKHIFTEKVLALTVEECNAVQEAVQRNGVELVISFFQKYLGSRIAVKSICDSGELGRINYLRFRNCHSGSIRNWLPAHFYDKRECGGGAMIDLGAHGMYLTEWILGTPVEASSAFTLTCDRGEVRAKNRDGVEDNAVTLMRFADGAIAVNETGFVSLYSPVILEVHGERGYVRMEDERVVKCTESTGGKVTEVQIPPSMPLPIEQFLTGKVLPGCSIKEARALTVLMTLAYSG